MFGKSDKDILNEQENKTIELVQGLIQKHKNAKFQIDPPDPFTLPTEDSRFLTKADITKGLKNMEVRDITGNFNILPRDYEPSEGVIELMKQMVSMFPKVLYTTTNTNSDEGGFFNNTSSFDKLDSDLDKYHD